MMPHPHTSHVIDVPVPEECISAPVVQSATRLDEVLFYGVLLLLFAGVLAFGATEAWGQFLQRTLAALVFGVWLARGLSQGNIELGASPLYLPVVVFGLLIAFQFGTGMTSYRYGTLCAALDLFPCAVLLLVTGDIFSRRRRLHNFVVAMAVFGFVVAFFALVQDFSGTTKIYGFMPVEGISAAMYGPYANHNDYAGLMEMLVPLAGAAAFLERGARRGLLLFTAAIMTMSVIFSRSRGGMIGLGVAMIFLCAVLFRITRRHCVVLAALAALSVVGMLTLWLANDQILHRLTETQDNYRLAIYRDCLHMWLHKPLLGFGYGTFSTVYPEFRSFFTNLRVNHAHNDYLELLVDMGLAGVVVAAWFLAGVFREGMRKIFDRNDEEGSILTLGAITGIVALLAHSMLDFNLRIASNAAVFYSLCFAVATPFRHRVRQLEFAGVETEEEADPVAVETQA
jgi:O-antigen ligase